MKKVIKRWGTSSVIVLSNEDCTILKCKEGDIIYIPDDEIKIIKKGDN